MWCHFLTTNSAIVEFGYDHILGQPLQNLRNITQQVPSSKLTWQWKMDLLKMYSLLKMGIFHCDVSLPECTSTSCESAKPFRTALQHSFVPFYVALHHVAPFFTTVDGFSWRKLTHSRRHHPQHFIAFANLQLRRHSAGPNSSDFRTHPQLFKMMLFHQELLSVALVGKITSFPIPRLYAALPAPNFLIVHLEVGRCRGPGSLGVGLVGWLVGKAHFLWEGIDSR